MKISVNWVKEFTDIPLSTEELVKKIGAQLGEIDEVVDIGAKYQGVVVAKVASCVKHPNADKLHVCKIDDGGVTKDVARDENGHVQVVCGAPNVREGLLVAWLPPGATVPSTYDKDPFVLEARDLRGETSNGMLASLRELAIGDGHDGILEVDVDSQPGASFAEVYKLDDHIIDVENKMFTHRPDCFGILGVAREIAGIQQLQFKSPDWYLKALELTPANTSLKLEVSNTLPEVPRFMAVALSNVQIKPSPIMMQSYLARVGIKPINNVVDITNFMMYLTAQPLHAYDYDKVKALDGTDHATLTARYPSTGEKIKLLNGKEIEPRPQAIMIATASQLIGVGGVMGGTETEVDANTKNIILEVASFDMYSIRRTAMAHGLFTDAVTRFNKGQSPLQNPRVLAKAVQLLTKLAGASQASEVIDTVNDDQAATAGGEGKEVSTSRQFINARLGLDLADEEILQLLKNVEFGADQKDQSLALRAPFWRTDIEIPEDIVEEIGRLYGYDRLPLVLPKRDLTPAKRDPSLELKKQIRNNLSSAGANEVLTYSFVHGNLFNKVGQDKSQAFQLSNALSPDLQYYRLSLTPSLLDKVHPNIKAGYNEFVLFELGKVHNKHDKVPPEVDLPAENHRLALVYATEHPGHQGAAYYQARHYLDYLATRHNLAIRLRLADHQLDNPNLQAWLSPFEPARSAAVLVDLPQPNGDNTLLGFVGEYKSTVTKNLKLPAHAAGFELDLAILQLAQASHQYQPLARFPKTTQDISFKVPADLTYQKLATQVQTTLTEQAHQHSYLWQLDPLDIYQPDSSTQKHISFRITLNHPERTLVTEEVNHLLDAIAQAASAVEATRI